LPGKEVDSSNQRGKRNQQGGIPPGNGYNVERGITILSINPQFACTEKVKRKSRSVHTKGSAQLFRGLLNGEKKNRGYGGKKKKCRPTVQVHKKPPRERTFRYMKKPDGP